MDITLRVALLIITLTYLFLVLKAIKNKKIQISFSIFWLITGIILLVALAIPNSIENISYLLGFELSVNMIFCVTIFISFYLIFKLTILLSKENKKNILLIQEISILKEEVEDLKESIQKLK